MAYNYTTGEQSIFQDEQNRYYLVEVYPNGKVTLKIKENGWSDTWSLPLEDAYPHGK